MKKLLTEKSDCNISGEMLAIIEKNMSPVLDYAVKKHKSPQTLSDCVKYFSKINDVENDLSGISFGFNNFILNDEISNKKVRKIALLLANAIDENSVEKIRFLKKEYGNESEFTRAKDFLNKKCKEIWNVFEYKNTVLKIPHEAMKSLGITNQPTLDFLLGDSVRLFEKDNGSSTANIIHSILNNKNLSYKMKDIHQFLKKEKCRYNFKTVEYLICEQNYTQNELIELGITKDIIEKSLSSMSFKNKLMYLFRNLKTVKISGFLSKNIYIFKSA